jgi:hypothetical protein
MGSVATGRPGQAGLFLLNFVELQIAMVLGALACFLLGRLIPDASSSSAAYHPGTHLYAIGDVVFLSVPVVAWMRFRGRGWRLSLELALAMIAPVAIIATVGEIAGYAYLLWLVTGMYPVMSIGLILYMLYRRVRFSDRADARAAPAWVDGSGSGRDLTSGRTR